MTDQPFVKFNIEKIMACINTSGKIVNGEYLYKYLLRGEHVNSINVVTDELVRFSGWMDKFDLHKLQDYSSLRFDIKDWNQHKNGYLYRIDFIGMRFHILISSYNEFITNIRVNGLNPTNALVYKNGNIIHVAEDPNIANLIIDKSSMTMIDIQFAQPQDERKWVIENVKAGRYCKSLGMKNNDSEYFKNWKIIDPIECAMHGFFDTRDRKLAKNQ